MPNKGLVAMLAVLTLTALLSGCMLFDTVTDSEAARAVVDNFLSAMENEDTVGMADLLDESFYTLNGITREGFIDMMSDTFSQEQFTSLTPTYSVARVSGSTGRFELYLNMKGTEQREVTGQDVSFDVQVYFIFDVTQTEGKWLITNFVQSTPDEPIIRQLVDDYVAALQREDLTALKNLLSEYYNDGAIKTRDDYLAYLSDLLSQIQINSYHMEYWGAWWVVNLLQNPTERISTVQVSIVLNMEISEAETSDSRMVVLGFGLKKVNGKWAILACVTHNLISNQ